MFFPSLWHFCFCIVRITPGARRCSAFSTFSLAAAPVVRQQLHSASFSSSEEPSSTSSSAVTTASTNGKEEVPVDNLLLPVGIFIDLDNIRWSTYSREDARDLVRPLRTFGQRIGGKIVAFQAFGNQATQTWRPPEEKERSKDGIGGPWHPEEHHTGYGKDGLLRCGICGARMKLSKKDRARGWDVQDKLNKHMKMLHDREQAKRINKSKGRKRKMSEKEMKKFHKYKAAQIDTGRRMGSRNQLFAILKEVGIRCHSANDVDAALIKNARQWMGAIPKNRTTLLTPQQELLMRLSTPSLAVRGCLMVLSNDSDFCELLEEGHRRGYLVVSVTLEERQTRALENVSDLVLRLGGDATPESMTRRGSEFMLRSEERWKKDRGLSPLQVWDLTGTHEDNENDDNDTSIAAESVDEKEGHARKDTPTQHLDAPGPYFTTILKQYPELDITNRDEAERLAAFTKLLRSTKKSKRRDLVRDELRIRLHHKDLYRSIPRPAKAGMDRLALVLHWAERGKEIPFNSFRSPARKYVKMSQEEQKKELQKRKLNNGGSKNQIRNRLLSAVNNDHVAEVMGFQRKALIERGLDDGGHNHEIIDRLVKSVLGLQEDAF